ncbi:MAG: DNA double-strand break repair nuclease NurA [Anaerolineae bacterium]|nr:MAG: DNA double-strand break repair nuclease NurA [Anaerolineae bacterium]
MALDFQQIYRKIKEIAAGEGRRQERLADLRRRARDLLREHAHHVDELRRRVALAREYDPGLRCASPVNEPLDTRVPAPASVKEVTLLAVDGSQAAPDRHAALQYALLNVGAIVLRANSNNSPEVRTVSDLLFGEALFFEDAPMGEGLLSLQRDLKERLLLDDWTKDLSTPVIALIDGPIELWGVKGTEDSGAYRKGLQQYLTVLSRLHTRGVILAGYVDKPGADLVVRLLEIAAVDESDLRDVRRQRPLRGVSDRWLFGEPGKPLLKAGERSAVFAMQSKSGTFYEGALSLHFFYLNVGTERHPWLARVEVPHWVAEDGEKLALLHAALLRQCRAMGARPYPYALHRAHEIAVVSYDEKAQVEQMLSIELRRQGVAPDERSYKQEAKERG